MKTASTAVTWAGWTKAGWGWLQPSLFRDLPFGKQRLNKKNDNSIRGHIVPNNDFDIFAFAPVCHRAGGCLGPRGGEI